MSVEVIDLRGEPCELKSGQWRRADVREVGSHVGICGHQVGSEVGSVRADRRRYGPTMAVARRFLRWPYHVGAGVAYGQPFVVIAHPFERYTFHGDAANRGYLGFAVAGRFPLFEAGRVPRHGIRPGADLMAAVHKALTVLCEMSIEAGHDGPLDFITHRQAQNSRHDDRDADPGEWLCRTVASSPAVDSGLVVPQPDRVLVEGAGLPWPAGWR